MENSASSSLSFFITAATSPLGQAVTGRLVRGGHRVYGLAQGAAGAAIVRAAGGLPVFADLSRASEVRSLLKMANADAVVHLETQTINGLPFQAMPWDAAAMLEATRAIDEAAGAAGARYFIHASYAFLYAPGEGLVDETAPLVDAEENDLLDAAIKAEKVVLKGTTPACVLRAGFIYGPHSAEIPALIDRLRQGRPIPSSSRPANWIHHDDLADAILLAAQQHPAGAVLNVVDDKPAPPADFLAQFAGALGLQPPGRVPGFLARPLGGKVLGTLLSLSSQASNARAREVLGWKPKYSTIASGIEDTMLTLRARAAQG